MSLFKKNSNNNHVTFNVEDIFVVTTTITSKLNDGTLTLPRSTTWYFLANIKDGEYHELFAGKKIEKKRYDQDGAELVANFNTPYIQKVSPLTEYIKDPTKKRIDIQLLFDFITKMNVLHSLGIVEKNEN